MINNGANVIVGTSFGFMDGLETSATKHPDIKYLHALDIQTETNMSNYFGRLSSKIPFRYSCRNEN